MGARGPVKGQARAKGGAKKKPAAKPKGKCPAMPGYLPEAAAAVWREVAPRLFALGLLEPDDVTALAGFCLAIDTLQWAIQDIADYGRTQRADSGYEGPRPAVAIQKQALEEIRRFSALFGLDPASRGRVNPHANSDEKAAENPFAQVFHRVQSARSKR